MRDDRSADAIKALFLVGVVLLVPPLLLVFNRPVRVFGIPLLYLYIFAVWAGVIALATRVSARIKPQSEQEQVNQENPKGEAA
jgi:hypothetical protein